MVLLVGDSSTSVTAVALRAGGSTLSRETDSGKSQSEKFLSLIDAVLGESKVRGSEIDALGLVEGPGSFTGLRIGFSVMKGLAFALKKPLYLHNRLDLMAAACVSQGPCLPLIDAYRSSWYTALYVDGKRVSDFLDLEESRIKFLLNNPVDFFSTILPKDAVGSRLHICGEWRAAWREASPSGIEWIPEEKTRRVDDALLDAVERDIRQAKAPADLMSAIPFYLRRSEAENLLGSKKSPP